MNPAEQMREAAAMAAWNVEGGDRWTRAAAQNAIRALPLPPTPPLADDVAGLVERATAALDGVTPGPQPLVKWLRNPWEKNHSGERGPIPQWLHALMLEAADMIERLEGERDFLLTCGIIELMIRNPNVDSYVKEWEARVERAEAEVARLRDGHLEIIRQFGDTPNGHMAAEISRAALTPKGADHE